MRGPRLSRLLTLETPQRAADGAGGYAEDWQALGDLWAEMKPRSGRETSAGGTTLSRVSYRITLRAAPEGSDMRPRPEQRFREGARVYLIRAVAELAHEGRYLVCFADEEAAA